MKHCYFYITVLCMIILLGLVQASYAQIPRMLSYQGVLTDSLGHPKADGPYDLTVRLYGLSQGGNVLWSEQKLLQLKRGLFSTILGEIIPFPDSIRFDHPYWIGLQIASEPEMSPRIQLTAVGYSLNSVKADTALYAHSARPQLFVDSARIAGSIPDDAVTSGKILNGSIQNIDVAPAFKAPFADTAQFARAAPHQSFVDSARISGTVPDNSITGNKIADFTIGKAKVVPTFTAPYADTATFAWTAPLVPHNHLGEAWNWGVNTANGLVLSGAVPWINGLFVASNYNNGPSIWGRNYNGGNAVRGDGYANSIGVYGEGASAPGVAGRSAGANGIEGFTDTAGRAGVYGQTSSNYDGYGLMGVATTTTGYANGVLGVAHALSSVGGRFSNDGEGIALWASSLGNGPEKATIRIHNNSNTYGMAAYLTNISGYHTAHFQNWGNGGVLFLQNSGDADGTGGNDFITAVDSNGGDVQFKVTSSGEVRSDVGFNTPAADFAEMLPAVGGLQASDVLVIGKDGKLTQSTQQYQTTVAGIYSTNPGFTGGKPLEGEVQGTIPLAITGVVPVKVSAENGAIEPGDLLVTSSTPAHAMKSGANPPQGSVIGKALESFSNGTGVIKILAILQ